MKFISACKTSPRSRGAFAARPYAKEILRRIAFGGGAPLVWLGEISYSLYLIHGFVQYAATAALEHFGRMSAPICRSACRSPSSHRCSPCVSPAPT